MSNKKRSNCVQEKVVEALYVQCPCRSLYQAHMSLALSNSHGHHTCVNNIQNNSVYNVISFPKKF
jgi:hypothetical protein